MNAKWIVTTVAALALFSLAAAPLEAQQAPPREEASSDVGNWGTVPYTPRELLLDPAQKSALRKLEDQHLAEVRALEDRVEREWRALRAKQSAEREALLKSLRR